MWIKTCRPFILNSCTLFLVLLPRGMKRFSCISVVLTAITLNWTLLGRLVVKCTLQGTVHSKFSAIYYTLYCTDQTSVQCTLLYSCMYFTTLYSVQYTLLYSALYCTVHSYVHCTLLSTALYCTVYYTVQCTLLYNALCYRVQCTMSSVHYYCTVLRLQHSAKGEGCCK